MKRVLNCNPIAYHFRSLELALLVLLQLLQRLSLGTTLMDIQSTGTPPTLLEPPLSPAGPPPSLHHRACQTSPTAPATTLLATVTLTRPMATPSLMELMDT